ncbi:MAG: alpha/beta-type small acid-soluble spore protein [Firmicutes bacterium]|nr:alpha/beta-type small acid-soluble spore protein [Bacillota bacterium]
MTSSRKHDENPAVLQARQALKRLRDEVARELDIDPAKIQGGYWGNLSAREAGAIGGRMVKRMIEAAERSLAEETAAQVRTGFVQGFNAASLADSQADRPGPGNSGKGGEGSSK